MARKPRASEGQACSSGARTPSPLTPIRPRGAQSGLAQVGVGPAPRRRGLLNGRWASEAPSDHGDPACHSLLKSPASPAPEAAYGPVSGPPFRPKPTVSLLCSGPSPRRAASDLQASPGSSDGTSQLLSPLPGALSPRRAPRRGPPSPPGLCVNVPFRRGSPRQPEVQHSVLLVCSANTAVRPSCALSGRTHSHGSAREGRSAVRVRHSCGAGGVASSEAPGDLRPVAGSAHTDWGPSRTRGLRRPLGTACLSKQSIQHGDDMAGDAPACSSSSAGRPPRRLPECVSSCLFRPQPRPHGPGTRGSLPPPAAPGLCGQGGSVHTRHLVSHRAGSSSGKLLTQGVWPWEGSRGRIRASRGAYWPRGPGPRPPPPVPLFLR